MACVLAFVLALLSMLSIVGASVSFSDLTRTPGQPQRSLVLQKMLRSEQVRIHNTKRLHNSNMFCAWGTSTDGAPQGLKDNAFLLKGLCDQVSNMTAGYSGALCGSVSE
jgi:hypothetical protein